MTAEVAIAVVSWNTSDLLRRCLRSMADEAMSGRCEVWVIDNDSDDGSADMVREEFEWASVIASNENLGFGPAVNEVARHTEAPWLAASNADIELMPGALDAMLAAGSDAGVGVVAPRLINADGNTQHSVHAFPTIPLAILFAIGAYRLPGVGDGLCIEGYWDAERPRDIDWAHGAFLLVRRAAFDQIRGFDDAQWMYAEDIDLHWRLSRAGWRARYEPSARIGHELSASTVKAFGQARVQRHLTATYAWQARRSGMATAWTCAVLNAGGAAARWLGFLIGGVASARLRAARRRAAVHVRAHLAALRRRDALIAATARPVELEV
jgi:GT2 family glycosyltransferase